MSDVLEVPAVSEDTSSLQILFSRDPLGYSEKDLDTIISAFRAQHGTFLKASGNTKRMLPAAKKKLLDLDLTLPSEKV